MEEVQSILIVDDDKSTCRSLSLIFGRSGYQVETANTGQEALKKAQGRLFNLVVLDIKLPDMEGVELIAPLKEAHPDLVVIMVTAHASLKTAVRALNEGACAYITKPLNMDEVLPTVREALEKRRLVVENRTLYEALKRELNERNYALQALRASEANLRNLITKNADGMAIVDDWGTVHFANPAAEALFEGKPQEYLGQALRFPIAAGEVAEVEIIRNNRETTTVEMTVADIEWEGKSLYLASLRDITQRKRAAEKGIRRLRSAVAQSIDGIAIGDLEAKLKYVNDAFAAMHDYSPEEMIGLRLEELVDDQQLDEFAKGMHKTRTEGSWRTEIAHVRKHGTPFPSYMSVSLLTDEKGNPTGTVAVCGDITELKEAQQKLKKYAERLEEMVEERTRELEDAHDQRGTRALRLTRSPRKPSGSTQTRSRKRAPSG